MKKLCSLLLFFCISLYANEFNGKVEKLINQQLPSASVGIAIKDAKTGDVIFQRKSNHAFSPASNLKILTATAALKVLSPQWQYTTAVYSQKPRDKFGRIQGDVYIKFTGDPSFTSKNLAKLIHRLKKKSIKKIQGNVVIDATDFIKPDYALGWVWNDLAWYFAAPITADIIDQNKIIAKVTPSKNLGAPTQFTLLTGKPYVTVASNVRTVLEKEAATRCVLVPSFSENNKITLDGCWPDREYTNVKFALPNPDLYIAKKIKALLKKNNIKLNGKIITGKMPTHTILLAQHQSKPLKKLVKTMLKHSNNLYAESLLKTLGYHVEKMGNFSNGVIAVKQTLENNYDIDFNHSRIFDGSGNSSYDLLTPLLLVDVLLNDYQDSNIKKPLMNALPISGTDGTLHYRLSELKGKIHAKTGTMTGVVNLSGFATTKSGKTIIFSIMINNSTAPEAKALALQDAICRLMVDTL